MLSIPVKLKQPVLLFFIFLSLNVSSQTLPSFQIQETNGKVINSRSLVNDKPLVVIYFSPDCDHCTTLLKSVFSKIAFFKKATILLVSFRPLNELSLFEKEYQTAKYKNIIVGIEQPVFFLRNLYNLESTPFTALYDKKGKLIISYKKDTPLDDLLIHMKNMK
ncbi:MAG: redoxin domain-containing protein [Ginsengibacter sp.]